MKEVLWLNENKEMLEIGEVEKLEQYGFFEQVTNGVFKMKLRLFVKMCEDALDIYNRYNTQQN